MKSSNLKNPQNIKKNKLTGLARLRPAFNYSMAGFKASLTEPAIRLELWAMFLNFLALAILAIYKYQIYQTTKNNFNPNHSNYSFNFYDYLIAFALSVSLWLFVLLVEIINTAIECAIDYISEERHPLAKKAKDLASAAVFLALLICLPLNALIFYKLI